MYLILIANKTNKQTKNIYIVTCFEVTRPRHVSRVTRLVADSRSRGNESRVASAATIGNVFTVHARTFLARLRSLQNRERKREQFSSRTVRSSSGVKGHFKVRSSSSSEKAGRVGAEELRQSSRLVGPGRRVGPVGLRGVQGTTSAKQTLLKKLIQVNCVRCRGNCFK
jgi:hypothetical protein